jgi:hypothetical protein
MERYTSKCLLAAAQSAFMCFTVSKAASIDVLALRCWKVSAIEKG